MLSMLQAGVYTIVGIDPGTNHLGYSALAVDPVNLDIIEAWAMTVHVDQTGEIDELVAENHTPRIEKLERLKKAVLHLFECTAPNTVCCESPFYNALYPSAYAPLVEVLYGVRMTVLGYDQRIPFTTYEPVLIKKIIGTKGFVGKDKVKAALATHPELINALVISFDSLDEHSLDALAVAYTHLKLLRQYRV